MENAKRLDNYSTAATALALLSDDQISELVGTAAPLASGTGGTTSVLDIDGTRVLVKTIPLCDAERRQENLRSTANIFRLPGYYQYGLGSAGFGAWREVAGHVMTTNWVLGQHCPSFPLMYHWRVLAGPRRKSATAAELAGLERAVSYWGDSPAVRSRLQAIAGSSAGVAVFLEYLPQTLHEWLSEQMLRGGAAAESACQSTEQKLRAGISFMNSRGMLHFDAHFNNVLTDGQGLYFTDFGLALCSRFVLSGSETRFIRAHRSYDRAYTMTHLANWLDAARRGEPGSDPLMREYEGGWQAMCLPPAAHALIARYAPVSALTTEFHQGLLQDKSTRYPAEEIERACAAAGLARS